MIHSDDMLGNGVLTLGNLDFNTALEATGRTEPDRSFLDAAITASDINNEVPRQLEPVVNPMQRLTDVCLYNEDEGAAERVTGDVLVTETARGDVFGQNMLIGVELADMMTGGDVYETAERFIGELPREQQQAWRDKLNHCHTKSDGQALVGELFRNGVVEQYRANKARQETLEEERGMAFNGVFAELVKDANNEEAWNRFREGQARGAFTEADKKSLDSAAKAWGMMEMLMNDYSRSGAAVLLDNESGERIFNELYGDEAAQAVFLNVLNNEVQDLKNDASRRNALVRFGQAFAASTNNLMAGVIGGKFKAFVTDEQVDAYNREWERARERSGRENPNVSVYAEGDNWVEKYLLPGNARIDAIRKAAQESGQMNQDGSLRKMTAEERKGTQELGAFRGQLFNAVQGMYDVPGVVAKLGRMMPDSMIYLVPGGMIASAGSMHTQELARRLGEGEDYVSANTKAAVEAGISAAVEKLAFGSLKPARMAPGLDWLMSRKVVGQALGRIYGSTAGRIGLGVVAGSAEETFAEPLAGLIMRGVYNVAAADELQLADPLGAYRKEMEEMLAPDQILVTGLYGLLLGGVSAGGHMQAAEDYREMYEHLVSIGVDEGRAAQAARDDAAVAGFKATKALFDEAVKKDTKGVIAYLAELYPHLEPLNVTENLFSTWQLPHLVPAENGKVKVQEQDEDGKVTETLMSKEAADLLVQARLEQLKSSEIAKFANQLLGVAMAGKASSETDRFIVEEVDGAMDADYFTRLANAAGVRLQQGARADEVDPEIHQHLTLGQLVQQGQAWEQRMEIQRNEVDQERARKNLPPLTDEEWAERKKAYVAAVNRQSVRGADGRKRTLLRVSRGHYGAMNVLEDLTEDFIARDMAANNRGLEWYVQNIRELETALGRKNEFLRELGEGKKPVNQMDIIEAVGKIAQSKLLADTVKGEHGFSAALKSFLEMIRTLILKAAAMLKLGKAINQVLTDETVRGKMDTEFLQLVDDVVAQDIEYLRELQLEDGLKAMQRVLEARQEANADTRVKRRRKAKTPVLDKAEKNHGKQVREAARKKRRKQAKVDADVEVAEAALEGDFSSSVVNQEELDAIKSATDNRGAFDGDEDAITMSVTDAQERGLFEDGVLEASNAVVTEPSFSIEALHATPHKFRKFSTDFMGSGEGNQAFGWGLYFAGNVATAKSYYDNFEKGNRAILQGDKQIASADVLEKIARELSAEGLSKEESKMYATGAVRRLMGGSDLAQLVDKLDADKKDFPSHEKSIEYQIKALRIILGLGLSTAAPSVYRVELNVDDSTLLLWDSPVSDALQAEIDALQKPVDEEDWQKTFAEMKALGIKGDDSKRENFAGYQVYNELVRKTGSAKAASEWLAERGYKGIKYLDGMSRRAGEGTYNYVIFSGDDVKITGVNETGDYNAPWEVYEDTDASFSVSDTLMEDIAMARKRAKNADGTVSQDGEMSRNDEVELCTMPDFMRFLGEPDVPVVARVFTLRKLLTDHKLTDALTYEVVQKMNDPVLAIQETPSTYLVLLDVQAENKDGVMAPVVCAVEHKKGKDGNRYLVSAYSLDNDKETKITQQFKKLVYCKYNTTAKFTADAPQGRAYDLLRAAISGGHTSNVPCKEDVVKWQQDFSSSLVNLDEESVAREVVDAGQGFLANLAYSEAIMREMRGAMQRLRKLGSKTRTDREDAVAAMGTMVQMVKAAVAGLPKGYRFSVHPYLNRIEALAELAATGDIDLTSDIASKDILQLENAEGVDLKKPYDEMVKEYGNVKLAEALERIMHRVSEQLRKHAKDRAVEKITELVERLAPKKDPKTGKLKGGKMSADAYRDLATVDKAMKMNAEQLEAKLTALRADLAKPGISEVLRGELEDKMTLYDQFGDLAGMTPEDAVAAYEVLRVRVYFHRFEWEDKQARVRGARRAVVRRVVDGVGSVSENEYNAKKRRVKPSQRLKNLGDILSGMPAALAGMRGYLPLRQMADELALRANAAGEAIKAWEAERWLALEALSKETMGKSWRECMDFMHKVQPSGVSFDRPKFRTVNVKTEELRELLAMTKEERKAEMKRRRESGGLEAERALSERDVQELQKKLEAMEEEDRVLSRVETRYMVEVQHEENLQLSRGEALYAILMFEQPTYTERLIMQGYTFEVIAGLREYVGDGMLQFGYGLRELFAKQGDRIAAVYENAFGVPFPREENYFAARWVVNGTKESPAEQLLAGMAGTAGAGNGWMKQRVNHNLELDMTKDALQVFLQATSLTDTWIATQDIVADFKAWTRDADFERALTAVLGQESYDNLKDWIRILEMGGVQDCLNMGVSQDVINGLYGSGAVAILGLRVQTLLKQTPAIFNGLLGAHDISAAEWFATLSKMKKGDAPMTYSRMVNSTLMKMRQQGKAGNMAGQAVRSGDTASSAAEGLLQASMLPMEWVDARCTAMGLVPVWNVYYQRAVNQGASHEEAERAAWEQTALVANLSSQPIGWLNKIKIAQSRNPIVKSAFYMLSENTAKFALCRALWRGGKKMAAFRAWLVYGAANAAISAMLDALQGDPEEFEKGKWWEYALSAFYGPASGIPGVGEALEAAVNALLNLTGEVADIDWMKKVKTRASAGRALVDIQGSAKALERVWGYMTDNKEHSLAEYTRAVGTVSRTLAIGTGWMGNMFGYWSTAVAVLMNPIDFGARVWRNMKHYWD